MAGTFTIDDGSDPVSVWGNMIMRSGAMDCADGSGQAVATGLKYITGFAIMPKSAATTGASSKWTKSGGNLTPTTCTSGDLFYCTVWGV